MVRVPLYASHDASALRRTAYYGSYALTASVIGPFLVDRPDIVYVYHTPPTVGLPGLVLPGLFRRPVVLDVVDLFPESIEASGMLTNPHLLRWIDRWCMFCYQRADQVVTVTNGFKDELCARGIPRDKVEVVYHWCDESAVEPVARDEQLACQLGMAGRLNIVYAGTMGPLQGLEAVLGAASIVEQADARVQFVFVGTGVEREALVHKAQALGLHNVLFLPRQPMSGIHRILSLADVMLVHLKDIPMSRITIPQKTQAYMAAAKPILMALHGEAAQLVEDAGAGLACQPEDAESIARCVLRFVALEPTELTAMGARARTFYQQNMSMRIGAARYAEMFERIVERHRNTRR